MKMFARLFAVIAVGLLLALPAMSAEIEILDLKAPYLGDESDQRTDYRCHFRLKGVIENGDLEKLKKARPNQYRGSIICLDSPGGSFAEAVRFIKFFQETMHGTWIERNAVCESACALIFMAGSMFSFEGGEYPWRVMHPEAKLGFHSPDLTVADGSYDAEAVRKAYAIALQSIEAAVSLLIKKRDFDGLVWVQPSLLLAILSTPPNSMYYVDDIDRLGLWRIQLDSTAGPNTIDDQVLAVGCRNVLAWTVDNLSATHSRGDVAAENFSITKSSDNSMQKWQVETHSMNSSRCTFTQNTSDAGTNVSKRVDTLAGDDGGGQPYTFESYHFLNPSTKLRDLANFTPTTNASVAASSTICFVVSGGIITDRDPCRKEVRIDQRKGEVFDYVWPSGGKTVLIDGGRRREINGKRGLKVEAPAGEIADCTLNSDTNNIFCVSPAL